MRYRTYLSFAVVMLLSQGTMGVEENSNLLTNQQMISQESADLQPSIGYKLDYETTNLPLVGKLTHDKIDLVTFDTTISQIQDWKDTLRGLINGNMSALQNIITGNLQISQVNLVNDNEVGLKQQLTDQINISAKGLKVIYEKSMLPLQTGWDEVGAQIATGSVDNLAVAKLRLHLVNCEYQIYENHALTQVYRDLRQFASQAKNTQNEENLQNQIATNDKMTLELEKHKLVLETQLQNMLDYIYWWWFSFWTVLILLTLCLLWVIWYNYFRKVKHYEESLLGQTEWKVQCVEDSGTQTFDSKDSHCVNTLGTKFESYAHVDDDDNYNPYEPQIYTRTESDRRVSNAYTPARGSKVTFNDVEGEEDHYRLSRSIVRGGSSPLRR